MHPRAAMSAQPTSEPLYDRHAAKVARLARALSNVSGKRPLSIRKRAVSHLVPKRNDVRRGDDKIDLRDFDEILLVDPNARICVAEPGVTFVDLVRVTLRYGLVPVVVPELKTITIGGAVTGASLESMSFRYGGFHDACLEYEVVTTMGEVLRCTPDNENALVFQMMHSSFGTLGVLTKLTFRLVPAKKYVHVRYKTYRTLDAYEAAIREHARREDVDFIDGIMHARDRFVLSVGRFVEHAPYTHRYDWVTVYYETTAKRDEDYLKTSDYFFRYDHGVTNPTPRSFVGRLFLGKLLDSSRLLRLAEVGHKLLSPDRPKVTLDVFVALGRLHDFMRWYDETIGHYPLWCVPYRARPYEWIADGYLDGALGDLFVDIAIYGLSQPPGRNYYAEIEEELQRLHGIKTLISHNFYDEKTFWSIFNKPNYDAVKARTDPKNVLRDLYSKTCGRA
jgi:FAD/FMN-containing dehydrogenase